MNPFTSAVAEVKLTTFLDGIQTVKWLSRKKPVHFNRPERAKNHFKTFMRSEMCDFDYIHVVIFQKYIHTYMCIY